MLQRNTVPVPVPVPSVVPLVMVRPGELVDFPTLLTGFVKARKRKAEEPVAVVTAEAWASYTENG